MNKQIETVEEIAKAQDKEKKDVFNKISQNDAKKLKQLAITICSVSDLMEKIIEPYDVEPFVALAAFMADGESSYNKMLDEIGKSDHVSH